MSLKEKLKNNELTIGSWITVGHQSIVEILAMNGFDWLVIDMEHTVIDYGLAQQLIAHIQSFNIEALVRVSKNEEVVIKRVLDAGADGVIIPMINSSEDAQKSVSYVKYPPVGNRGVGLARAQKYGFGFEEYKEWLDKSVVIIAQIEHYKGVENIKEIINTPGIDGVFIGPYDLSGSLNIPGDFHNQIVINAIKKVEKSCQMNDFPIGYHVIEPNSNFLKEKIDEGYKFLAFSTDCLFMGQKIRKEMKDIIDIFPK